MSRNQGEILQVQRRLGKLLGGSSEKSKFFWKIIALRSKGMFEEIEDKHLDSNPQTMHILMLRATSASYQKDDRQFKIHHARYITNYSPPTEQKSEDEWHLRVTSLRWHWEIFSNCKCIVMVLSLCHTTKLHQDKGLRRKWRLLKVLKMFHLEANCPLLNPLSSIEFLKVVLSYKTRSRTFEKWLPYSKCISWLRRQQPRKEVWMFAKWK